MDRYFDAIVIGGGLGGLTAAALCARAGLRVLVLERMHYFGGAATVYRHHGLRIEASLHETDGFDEDDPKLAFVRTLELDRHLELVDIDDLYEVRGKILGAPFRLPHGHQAALAAATARFPQHKAGLTEYFRRLTVLRGAVSFAARHQDDRSWWLAHAPEAVWKLWPILRDGRASLSEVMNELFGTNEAVKLALAANLLYYHDDPDRMLFLRYAIPQASYLIGGGHYIRGGSRALSDALVTLIKEAGGTLGTRREADVLLLENGRIAGVGHHRTEDGGDRRLDRAPLVFGNAAPHVLADMLPPETRTTFLDPYARRRLSISLWTASLGLSRPAQEFGVTSYSNFVLPDWMHSLSQMREASAVMGAEPGQRLPPYVFVDYGQVDSGLNKSGPYLVSFCGSDRLENWEPLPAEERKIRKEKWLDALVADIDRHFPGIAGAVTHREMATAATMRRFLNTPAGAVYGFAPEGTLGEAVRQGPRTEIAGLWLASSYTTGGGFTGAMLGGAQAATRAMRDSRLPRMGRARAAGA